MDGYNCLLCIIGFVVCALACSSHKVRYYLKLWTYVLVSSVLAITLPIPQFIMTPRDYRNAILPAWGCRLLIRALGVSFEVRGIENVDRSHGAVVLINHQSLIDLSVLANLWPVIGRATVVSKKELLYVPPFGIAAYLWGTLFIDRSNRTESVNKLNQETVAIRENAAKLLFFPEGTRHQGDTLLPFKKGAFHIAVQSESAIQPVVVSRYRFLDSERKWFGRGHAIIHILPEISCKNLRPKDVPKLLETTQQLMQKKYDELNAETSAMHKKSD